VAGRFNTSKRLIVTMVLGLAVLGIGLGTASAGEGTKNRAFIYKGSCVTSGTPGNSAKKLGWAEWRGKNGNGVVVGTVVLPPGEYEVQLLHDDCTDHTGGTGNTFKSDGSSQKFSLKAPGADDSTMYVKFSPRPGGGQYATSTGIKVAGN
jgi:hypothetical protein